MFWSWDMKLKLGVIMKQNGIFHHGMKQNGIFRHGMKQNGIFRHRSTQNYESM